LEPINRKVRQDTSSICKREKATFVTATPKSDFQQQVLLARIFPGSDTFYTSKSLKAPTLKSTKYFYNRNSHNNNHIITSRPTFSNFRVASIHQQWCTTFLSHEPHNIFLKWPQVRTMQNDIIINDEKLKSRKNSRRILYIILSSVVCSNLKLIIIQDLYRAMESEDTEVLIHHLKQVQ